MALQPTYSTFNNEGCTLHFWYQGSGPLLVLISGGGGNGNIWKDIMPLLAEEYTVVAFDRRGNLRSALGKEHQKPLNMPQQARDVIAIIQALGFEKAHIHGNSGGGVIALHLASNYPVYVATVVAHEFPTAAILPDVAKILDFDQ